MTGLYSTKYGTSMLISTTIREEDEDECTDVSSACPPGSSFQQYLPVRNAAQGNGYGPAMVEHSSSSASHVAADKDRRLSHLAANAVSSITSATSRLIHRIMHSQQGRDHDRRHNGHCCVDGGKAATATAGPVKRSGDHLACTSAHDISRKGNGSAPQSTCSHSPSLDSRPVQRTRPQVPLAAAPPPSSRPGGHLVRLMDGDDIRLALQALQLAAQIHDHVWGPPAGPAEAAAAGGGDPRGREALLEAASPLYDTAMAAARAIQHRALHSLVKQAVRRYVNPCRGSPDDVLRVILELLTGCGGAAAAAAAAPASASKRGPTSRCLSDIARGYRGIGGAARSWPCAGAGAALDPGAPTGLEGSGDSRLSPKCHYRRTSWGSSSSWSGRSSTRSSLDSGGGSEVVSCPPARALRAALHF